MSRPHERTFCTMRCRGCDVEVDVYTSVVGGWCQCGSVLSIVSEKTWTIDTRSQPLADSRNGHKPPLNLPEPPRAKSSRRLFLDAYKQTQGCIDCGTHDGQLEFAHRPGEPREFAISKGLHKPWSVIVAEVSRCDVTCARCHARRNNNGFRAPERTGTSPSPTGREPATAHHG